ncbi:Tim44 domain-containing protein [Endozoicomonas sp. 8E]|uniref:Tim44 domain-containing protein n=1 Tax=Endozoicomonas sp. 8E TaxID=3035692 RepID=UPI002939546B|nr:TIM44-like domain-containing protein [Endozoicomonas sp. 8E]WOG26582.1 TIM44-like domain-containing protein [Endozoicomonas sp. 8E]
MIKRFASFMAIIMAFSFVFNVPVADAKKFGGGKSFGRSYNTAPAPKQPAAAPQQGGKQTAAQGSRKGMLGGLLGGLLAGGLIASLFGGAFTGLQMMDILIIALLAFVLFKVFRSMNRAKAMAAGHGGNHAHFTPEQSGQNQPSPSLDRLFGQNREQQEDNFGQAAQTTLPQTGFGASDVPMNLPEGFNLSVFMNGARDHYRTLQEAWNRNDLDTIREYLDPELFLQLKAERAMLDGDQHTEVMFVDAELGRADYNDTVAEISVRFTGKYRDTVEGVEEDITDIWHLQRSLKEPDAPWLIVGIEA